MTCGGGEAGGRLMVVEWGATEHTFAGHKERRCGVRVKEWKQRESQPLEEQGAMASVGRVRRLANVAHG